MKFSIPEDDSELRAFAATLLEENERLRELLRGYGVTEVEMPVQTVTLCDDSSGQLQIKISDEPDQSGVETVNPKYGVETGFHLTKRSDLQSKLCLFRLLFTGRGDVYAYRWTNKKGT